MSWMRSRAASTAATGADRAHRVALVSLVVLTFLQRPGRTTFDTKFDLTADPGGFLERTLHLWNPELSFGELQNQAYGYLFPQGAFFLGGDLLGLPDWVVQRLWSALILVVAYDGARRLMRAIGGGSGPQSPWVPVVAGLAFALSPRLLGLSGVLTAEILPTAVLPWVLLPLVHALRGRYSPRLGALLSGVAVLFMGGVNAVENLAALPLPALLLAFALGSVLGRRLALWWSGAVVLACAWWMLPLLVLGRYSPPFLDYIETSTATTHPLGWVNATRGADHWLAFISVGGEPWWPGAFALATDPVLIGATALVAALSLAGLFHPSMPARLPLTLSVLLGLVLLTIGHIAPLASPLSDLVRELLDGPLAPLRNVHKVDPLIRLPLALGFAHGVGLLLARTRGPHGWRPWIVRTVRPAVVVGAVGVLLLSAQPLFDRDLRKPGWESVPRAWFETADFLNEHADGRRALVLPGSGFGQQTWGWTIDEPLQGLARSPWVARTQVPLVPGPTIRFLDSIDERISEGRGSTALADVLARSGIGYVVVRRDLDLLASGAPSPSRVDQAMALSPGLSEVARFGSTGLGDQAAITVYAVQRQIPRVEVVETAGAVRLAGGAEDVITLLEAGALGSRAPVLVSTDGPDLVADGYRLRERQFGRLRDSLSQIMTRAEGYRNARAAHDYPGVPGVERVHAVYPEIRALSASSSSGYADILGPIRPELGPYAAVDGLPGTYWRSAPLEDPRGQWLQVSLQDPQPLSRLDLTLGVDAFSGVPVRRVRVAAGDGDREQVSEHAVDPATGAVRVELSGAPVDRVRVTVLSTLGDPEYGVVAIREITFPGLALGRSLAVPFAGDAATGFVFRTQPERRACVGSGLGRVCDPDEARPSEEEAGIERTFRTTQGSAWSVTGTVTAKSAPATARLLLPLGGQVAVGASSVLADDPSVSGQFAFDGDPGTDWLSARGDVAPSLTLRWKEARTVSRLQVLPAVTRSRTPVFAVVEADGVRREVDLAAGSLGFFDPIRTDRLTITFPIEAAAAGSEALPVGVGDLVVDGLEDLTYAPDPDALTGADCGLGPEVRVDGTLVRTRVTGRIGDVLDGTPLRLEPCDEVPAVPAGSHTLSVPATDRFAPTSLVLTPRQDGGTEALRFRRTEIRAWGSTDRTVHVGPGEEALLRVPENLNAGWRATLDGRVLEQTAIDGWQQAYRVPAGEGGLVRLVYTPDRAYRTMLLLGALAGAVLLLGAGAVRIRERRRRPLPTTFPPAMSAGLRAGPGGIVLLVVSGVLGGAALLLGAATGLLLRGRSGLVRLLAVVLVAASGLAAAVVAHVDDRASWEILDGLTGGAVGLLMAALVARRTRED